jgi:hypothetical protein
MQASRRIAHLGVADPISQERLKRTNDGCHWHYSKIPNPTLARIQLTIGRLQSWNQPRFVSAVATALQQAIWHDRRFTHRSLLSLFGAVGMQFAYLSATCGQFLARTHSKEASSGKDG